MELRYNEVPSDWQNVFPVTRFRYIEVLSIYFSITEVKQIVRFTEDFVISRFVISRFHCTDVDRETGPVFCSIQ